MGAPNEPTFARPAEWEKRGHRIYDTLQEVADRQGGDVAVLAARQAESVLGAFTERRQEDFMLGMKAVGGKLGELASRWYRRHDPKVLDSEYAARRDTQKELVAQLATQIDPLLYAEVQRTAALAEEARRALESCQYDCDIVPGIPGLSYQENQERLRRVSAARKNLPILESAAQAAQSAHEKARAALESAVGELCAPIAGAAARRVPEAERAAQQLIRDAKEDARWAAGLAGEIIYRIRHPHEYPQEQPE